MQKKFGALVNEFLASEAANWADSQESRGQSKNQIKLILPSSGRIFKIRIFKARCRDRRATESAEFLKDNAGIHVPLNRAEFIKGDAGTYEPPNQFGFLKRNKIHEPLNRSEFLKGDEGIRGLLN